MAKRDAKKQRLKAMFDAEYDEGAGDKKGTFFDEWKAEMDQQAMVCYKFIISRPARRREIIICTMCVCTCVRACVCHAVFSETITVTHFW